MPLAMNVPVLLVPVAVFVGILALVSSFGPARGSQPGSRVRDYSTSNQPMDDASIALTSRRQQSTSAVERVLDRVSAIAPLKLREWRPPTSPRRG